MVALLYCILQFANAEMPFIEEPNYSEQAAKHLGQALYKQFDIGVYLRRMEKRYIHKDVKKYGAYVFIIGDIAIRQEIRFKWEF